MRRSSPFLFGLAMLGLTIISEAFGTYLVFYYVDTLALVVGLLAIGRTIYAVWDAVNDPLFGYLSDRTRSRWGRRKPWLLLGLPFFLLFFIATFSVPGAFRRGMRLFWYFFIVTFIYEGLATVMWVNYSSLFPELFRSGEERATATTFKQTGQMVGLILGIALTPMVYARFGFSGMAVLYAVLGGALLLPFVLTLQEDPEVQATKPLALIPAFKETLVNLPFWVFAAAGTLLRFAISLFAVGMPFYARYSLGLNEGQTTLLFVAVFAVALPMLPFWSWVARRVGGYRAWTIAMLVFAVSAIPLYFSRTLVHGLIAGGLVGIAFGGVQMLGELVLAEVIDRDVERTGQRREGIYYSVNGFVSRISSALHGLVFVLLGVLFGYVSGDNPGPHPDVAFRFLLGVIPFVTLLIAWVVAMQYPKALARYVRNTAPASPLPEEEPA